MKHKEYKVYIDLVEFTIITVQTDDVLGYRNNILTKTYPELDPYGNASDSIICVPRPDERVAYIIIPFKTKYESTSEVLVHEIVHVVDYIIDYFGFEGTEIRAYTIQYLYRKYKKMMKLK